LLVDGIPVADVESGLADWQGLATSEIRRLELLRGPGASLYGDTAMGGVVQVFTTRSGTPQARVSAAGGSYGSVDLSGGMRSAVAAVGVGLDGGYRRHDGGREHSGREEARLSLAVDHTKGSGQFRLSAAGFFRERDEAGSLTAEEFAEDPSASSPFSLHDREQRKNGRASLNYARQWSEGSLSAGLHASGRTSEEISTLLLAPGFPDTARRTLSTDRVGVVFDAERRLEWRGRETELRGGLDLSRESLETDYAPVGEGGGVGEVAGLASAVRTRFALFASHAWALSTRLRGTVGLRWDRIEDQSDVLSTATVHEAWSPRFGVNLRLGDLERVPTTLFFQYSRAFKTPTIDQLFDPRPFPDFQGGSLQISNPTLRPQRARNLEVGASGGSRQQDWQVLGYWMDVDDEIDFDVATFRYGNILRSRHTGVEVGGRFFRSSRVSPAFSYSWSRVRSRLGEVGHGQLKNVPEHLFRPSLSLNLGTLGRLELRYTLMASRYLDDANTIPLADASLLDLRLERRQGGLRAFLDLLNIANNRAPLYGFTLSDFAGAQLPYFYPSIGFAARAGVEFRF
jgi:outer membrane receptor protein involved in Fe transport